MDLQVYILLLSACLPAGDCMVKDLTSLNRMQSVYVCDDKEVVFSCTANCSEVIHWWNDDTYFCTCPVLHDRNNCNPIPGSEPPVHVEVIPNNCNLTSRGSFTSELTFNSSPNVNNAAQIGCFILPEDPVPGMNVKRVFPNNTCTPREPSSGEQNSNITLHVANCTGLVPNPPRYIKESMTENNLCESEMRNVIIDWEPPLSPVTDYNLSCTSTDGEGNCSELLPANTTSFTLSVAAGIQYTIMVSALIGDRESKGNPQLNLMTVKVVNETSSEDDATIWLQVGNITANLTISYGPCSEPSLSYTTVAFMTPAIQLVNLAANTTYCYSTNVTDTASDATVGSCYGTFTTTAEATTAAEATTSPATLPIQPYADGVNVAVIVGSVLGVVAIILFLIFLLAGVVGKYVWKKKNTKNDGMRDGQTPRDRQTEKEMRRRSEDERNE